MKNTLFSQTLEITSQDITNYLELLKNNPIKIVTLILNIHVIPENQWGHQQSACTHLRQKL